MFRKRESNLSDNLSAYLEDKTHQYVDRVCREIVATGVFVFNDNLKATFDDLAGLMILRSEKERVASRTVVQQVTPYSVNVEMEGSICRTTRAFKGKDEPNVYVSGIPSACGKGISQKEQAAMMMCSMVSFSKGVPRGQIHNADPALKRYLPDTMHALAKINLGKVQSKDMVAFYDECKRSLDDADVSDTNRCLLKACPPVVRLAKLERGDRLMIARPHKMVRKKPKPVELRGKMRAFCQLIGSPSSGLGGLAESHVDGMFDVVGPIRKIQDRVTDFVGVKKSIHFLATRDMSLIFGCFNKLKQLYPNEPACVLFNGDLTEFPTSIIVKDRRIVGFSGDCIMPFPAYALSTISAPIHYTSFESPPSQPQAGASGRVMLREAMIKKVEGLPKTVTSYQFYFPMYVVSDDEVLCFRPSAFVRKGWGVLVPKSLSIARDDVYHYCVVGVEHAVTYAWRSVCLQALLPKITPTCRNYDFTRVSDEVVVFDEEIDKLTGVEYFPTSAMAAVGSRVVKDKKKKEPEEEEESETDWSAYEDYNGSK